MIFDNLFLRAFGITVSPKVEGGYSDDPDDKGNWTGGEVGKGQLNGTKWGISAAAYPQLDIRNLSIAAAREIYWRDYWREAGCHLLPPRVALVVFDAAVNHGWERAAKLLQEVVGTNKDGKVGQLTATAARQMDQDDLIIDFTRVRMDFMRGLKTFPKYGKGWHRRAIRLAMEGAR